MTLRELTRLFVRRRFADEEQDQPFQFEERCGVEGKEVFREGDLPGQVCGVAVRVRSGHGCVFVDQGVRWSRGGLDGGHGLGVIHFFFERIPNVI